MNTRQLLLDAIRRNRAADLPRLMFADYLDETEAEPERAEFIRVDIDPDGYRERHADELKKLIEDKSCGREPEWRNHPCPRCERWMYLTHHPENLRNRAVIDFGVFDLSWWVVDAKTERGFVRECRCSWEAWAKNAARILPEHPALELVRLTTPPVIDYRRHQRTEPDRHHLTLEARAAGMRATSERVVSRRELERSSFDLIAMTWEALRHDLRPESVLASFWGGDPAKGKWGVRFELPRPDAHGGQYRHWREISGGS